MIKATMGDGAYILGITNENIKHLKRDEPIHVDLKDLGGPDVKVFIVWGEYESAILKKLKDAGLITDETKKMP